MKRAFALGLMVSAAMLVGTAQEKPAAKPAGKSAGTAMGKAGSKSMSKESKEATIRKAMSAGPADIARNAAIVAPGEGGQMKELRPGTNGWVCMAEPEPMCLDKQWQQWADAWMAKKDPIISSVGIGYMLLGDKGASNTDPYAKGPTADNQWVVSPAHVMVLTPDTKQLNALPTDPHNGGPWVMWKDTRYAHIMVPIAPMAKRAPAKSAANK